MGDMQQWAVGGVVVTSVVEEETHHIPPEFFLPEATTEAIAAHSWLVPDYADERGRIALRVQALVIDVAGRHVLVDPCVGNGKTLQAPFWSDGRWPFMERFAAAGFTVDDIDVVVHTHLHADHVGWDTHRDGDAWVPTFTSARHLYTQRALDYLHDPTGYDHVNVLAESVQPIFDAGLAEIIDEEAELGDGLRLESSPGHTPGHVSLWIEAAGGETALISGDFLHHPVQCAVPTWAEVGDSDPDQARATRHRMLAKAASIGALFIGTHFPTRPAGRVVEAADHTWKFVPEP